MKQWEAKISAFFVFVQAAVVVLGICHNNRLLNSYESNRSLMFFRDLATRMDQADELLLPQESLPVARMEMNTPIFSRSRTLKIVEGMWKGKERKQVLDTVLSIFDEARRFGFDPYFLLAVIERESRFNPNVRGRHGEIGLMQIKPETAKWIAERYGFPWTGAQMLYDPATNIRFGAAYLDFLRRSFRSDGLLYLSAYNMGPKRTREVLRYKNRRSFYASEVVGNYIRMHNRDDDNG